MAQDVINGKVVSRWFTRGKARIPIFEDGSIGIDRYVTQGIEDREKLKGETREQRQKWKNAFYQGHNREYYQKIRDKWAEDIKNAKTPQNERFAKSQYDAWDKNLVATATQEDTFNGIYDYPKEYKGDPTYLDAKHAMGREIHVPYEKYGGGYTGEKSLEDYYSTRVYEENDDSVSVLMPHKLQPTRKQIEDWNGKSLDKMEVGDLVKAPYTMNGQYDDSNMYEHKLLEKGEYPSIEEKIPLVMTKEQAKGFESNYQKLKNIDNIDKEIKDLDNQYRQGKTDNMYQLDRELLYEKKKALESKNLYADIHNEYTPEEIEYIGQDNKVHKMNSYEYPKERDEYHKYLQDKYGTYKEEEIKKNWKELREDFYSSKEDTSPMSEYSDTTGTGLSDKQMSNIDIKDVPKSIKGRKERFSKLKQDDLYRDVDLGINKNDYTAYQDEQILDSVVGQMSDGIWENSPRASNYWSNMDFGYDKKGNIVMRTEKSRWTGNPFATKTDEQIKNYIAEKAKQIVKIENEDNGGLKWDRSNDNISNYLTYDKPVTVADVYSFYDRMKGRTGKKYNTYGKESFTSDELDTIRAKIARFKNRKK